jgi:hexosaminidase
MKKQRLLILTIIMGLFFSCARKEKPELNLTLIPKPQSIEKTENSFDVSEGFQIGEKALNKEYIQEKFEELGFNSKGDIDLKFINKKELGTEEYILNTKGGEIKITSGGKAGEFYAIQTLLQLIKDKHIPELVIKDKPRYSWRAYMLDEARHFQGKEAVKTLMDEMARLKLNVFHWHLTDDQGWRIEIKKYPKLTEIGSKRDSTEILGPNKKKWGTGHYDGKVHQGFYTQNEIKELIAYAAKRNITIVPEIGMPGHASAAIASYPELGSRKKQIKVPFKFGVADDAYDPSSKKTMQFLQDVLTEVSELFPSKTIHIGGDEVKYEHWKSSKAIDNYKKRNKLKTFSDVQVKFTNEISQFVDQKLGKRIMGWNEIMGHKIHGWEKGKKDAKTKLSDKAIVHFWKGNKDIFSKAIKGGYKIVNSTHTETYLDYDYKYIPLKRAYSFNPTPDYLKPIEAKQIIGLGCQMWGEWIPTKKDLYHMTFPRIAAYAEVGWTEVKNKNYDDFLKSLEIIKQDWVKKGIYVKK